MSTSTPLQEWQAERYAQKAQFVSDLGTPVVELLAPRPGERVLDLGCGDGALTLQLERRGAVVVGVDASADMIRRAREQGLDAQVLDGAALAFDHEFDAVFSNAALHWMKSDPDAVIQGVARSLRPGGRFVGEMGGHGNVAAITVALTAVLERLGQDGAAANPWYFPTPEGYRARLEAAGFAVPQIELIPRPTPLAAGIEGWLETFAGPFLRRLPEPDRAPALEATIKLLTPVLRDERGRWTADYVRLRFEARLPA